VEWGGGGEGGGGKGVDGGRKRGRVGREMIGGAGGEGEWERRWVGRKESCTGGGRGGWTGLGEWVRGGVKGKGKEFRESNGESQTQLGDSQNWSLGVVGKGSFRQWKARGRLRQKKKDQQKEREAARGIDTEAFAVGMRGEETWGVLLGLAGGDTRNAKGENVASKVTHALSKYA